MKLLILTAVFATALVHVRPHPLDASDAIVEIEKQRLVKFPDDIDQEQRQRDESLGNSTQKSDEAKRILEEIAKINQAFGYVKKQPEQPKLPPILDSSQYLFPKPAYQPFHAQNHQFAGSGGQTLLVPSIRAVKLDHTHVSAYNVPPKFGQDVTPVVVQPKPSTQAQMQTTLRNPTQAQFKFYYRPNEVHVPPPQTMGEVQQLPTHFAIPVRLYKLNREEYLREFRPEEYRIKGYKIIGDIDSFYGKAKAKAKSHKTNKQGKATPKYHLFFLPRDMALDQKSSSKHAKQPHIMAAPTKATHKETTTSENLAREEKLANRPLRVQVAANSNLSNAQTGLSSNASTSATQVVRKRLVPKPLRRKETTVQAEAAQVLPSAGGGGDGGGGATLSSSINSADLSEGAISASAQYNTNRLSHLNPFGSFRPGHNMLNLTEMQANTTTAIKNAFQNIFKFPFRPSAKPLANTDQVILQSVPLQSPSQPYAVQAPQPLYTLVNSEGLSPDYKWEDELELVNENANGAPEVESNSDEQSAEKHIFGHKGSHLFAGPQGIAHQTTQKQALREGGIIIQRLKVRKGGIAIAGPGGVATAGSGGTAIVGPGGYALTHPRSLTIAGPGAKVIAIPSSVDLKDALQRTNLRAQRFPEEGRVVATGPTVYYAPPTGDVDAESAT